MPCPPGHPPPSGKRRFDKEHLPSRHVTEGPYRALQRTFYYAMGLGPDEVHRPFIGVASAWDARSWAGEGPLRMADLVQEGVWAGGATPRRFATVAGGQAADARSQDGAGPTLVGRELVADSVELTVRGHSYDALVGIAAEPVAMVGLALGMCRLDVPSVLVPVLGAARDAAAEQVAVAAMIETIGLALPGAAAVGRAQPQVAEAARQAGRAVTDLVYERVPPRTIVTAEALRNGAAVLGAIGADADLAIHLMAIARECGVATTLRELVGVMAATPQLARTRIDPDVLAGGLGGVLSALIELGLVDGGCATAGGTTLAEAVAEAEPVDAGSGEAASVGWAEGALAPDGALVSYAEGSRRVLRGQAKVFRSEADACGWLRDEGWDAGVVPVVRGQGPVGAPGLLRLDRLAALIETAAVPLDALVITDGRMRFLPNVTGVTAVGPEAAREGPLAELADGDRVELEPATGVLGWTPDDTRPRAAPEALASVGPTLTKYRATVRAAIEGATTHPGASAEITRYADLV